MPDLTEPLTGAFFERMSAVSSSRDGCTGEFLTIEPTGRIDSEEKVAILHDANISLAAYLHEIGSPALRVEKIHPPVIWQGSSRTARQ
jgi:hypothetical protein